MPKGIEATTTGTALNLQDLEALIHRDLDYLNLPAKPWVLPLHDAPEPTYDVVVVGAGMIGLAATAALRLRGISSVICLDRAPEGTEGPWVTYGRMVTLRTAKSACGPALGIPSLTFRAWFEAQFGNAAWEHLNKIPRAQWMDYLIWYRRVLDLPVRNGMDVTDIAPQDDGLIRVTVRGASTPVLARRVILATGIDGLGAPSLPAVTNGISPRFCAHSADMIDFTALAGKRVGVVGAGASAMDNAASALEAGAAGVDLFVRREALPSVDKFTGISSDGLVMGYVGLPDAVKWEMMRLGLDAPVPPPRDSTRRVFRHKNARLHVNAPLLSVEETASALTVTTPHGETELDFLIFATGFSCDVTSRPELSSFASKISLWDDHYTPPAGEESKSLGQSPYLAPDFSFVAREDSDKEPLSRIYCLCFASVLSHGKLTSGAPAMDEAVQRLVHGVAASFLRENSQDWLNIFREFDRPELLGDEWHPEQIVNGTSTKVKSNA